MERGSNCCRVTKQFLTAVDWKGRFMAEIPEHLLKRAEAAREKAQANQESNSPSSDETTDQTTVAV